MVIETPVTMITTTTCVFRLHRYADLLHTGWLKARGGATGLSRWQQEVHQAHPVACRAGVHQSGGGHPVSAHLTTIRTSLPVYLS